MLGTLPINPKGELLSLFRPGLDGQFGTRELFRLVFLLTSFHEDILPDLPVVTAIIEYMLARPSEKFAWRSSSI
jgi:hypothetical protein